MTSQADEIFDSIQSSANLGDYSAYNAWIAGGVSLVTNTFLVYVLLKVSNIVIGPYKMMMIAMSLSDVFFSLVYVIGSPTISSISYMRSLIFVKGGIQLTKTTGVIALVLAQYVIYQSVVLPPASYIFRYIQVCRTQVNLKKVLPYLLICPPIVALCFSSILSYATYPGDLRVAVFFDVAKKMNRNRPASFLVGCLDENFSSRIRLRVAICSLFALLIGSAIIMTMCWRKMVVTIGNQIISDKSRRLHRQMKIVLFAQFVVPFVLVHVPFYTICIAPFFDISTGVLSELAPFLFTWTPIVNPIIIIVSIRDYRRFAMKMIKLTEHESSSTPTVKVNTITSNGMSTITSNVNPKPSTTNVVVDLRVEDC